jgi:transposase
LPRDRLGGRPAATLSRRLNVRVSNDTLLRIVRRRGAAEFAPPTIVGIDDWAWKRNHRYGTLLCDLERRRTIALLPDREPASAEAWLVRQPQICIVARDRGGGYARAAQRALPQAVQIADRWHLMENASRAFLDAVGKSMRQIRKAIGAARIDPRLLTYAETLQYEGFQRREETNASILSLSQEGVAIREIVRQTGIQPRSDPQNLARPAFGHLPHPAQLARTLPAVAGRTMDKRLPKRPRAVASLARTGISGVAAAS